jgi:alginate O-acetyltransferase complex protein AlgI
MLFPTLDFALFFLIVYALTWTLNDHNSQRKLFLLSASYFFYGYWDWRFVFLLAGSSLFNFYIGRRTYLAERDSSRKLFLTLGIVGNLSVLGFFK